MRPRLTKPDSVAMTGQQHEQAVAALAAMIVAWLQQRAHDDDPHRDPTGAEPEQPTLPPDRDRRTS